MNCLKLLVAATALGMASQAYAAPDDAVRTITTPRVNYVDKITGQVHNVLRCGFENPSTSERMNVEARLRDFRASYRSSPIQGITVTTTVIPVHFHVITTNSGAGNVPDSALDAQIATLNAAYAGSGFQFAKQGYTRTKNTTWYNACDKSTVERQIRKALAVDPAHTFNVYTCGLGGGLLGRATFPSSYPEYSFMHGVVILNGTVPGGSAGVYNGGDTLVHETGHYLGLYHTFQGGCANPGDEVADTPQEKEPDYSCTPLKDSCPLDAGLDPNTNYMDYGNDACMTQFTTLQRARVQEVVGSLRPSLGH